MIEIRNVENIALSDWQNLLSHSPTASYFQSPEFFDFFNSLSFLETFGWGVFENKILKALVCGYIIANGGKLKRYFSRRAIIHGGLLLAEDVEHKHISTLLDVLKKELSDKAIYIEIRNNFNFSQYKTVFQEIGFEYHSHLNYKVYTRDINIVKSRYSESKIRQIRKSKEQGVIFKLATTQRDIDGFYHILSDLYKYKIKKPLFPVEFFEKFVQQPNCYLFVVTINEKVIGGIACAAMPDKALYEWFVCGNTEDYNHLYPSVFATHKGIEFAVTNGFEHFDFMGAGKPDVEYGVRDFKEKFGGELVDFGRFVFISNPILYKIGRTIMKFNQKLQR